MWNGRGTSTRRWTIVIKMLVGAFCVRIFVVGPRTGPFARIWSDQWIIIEEGTRTLSHMCIVPLFVSQFSHSPSPPSDHGTGHGTNGFHDTDSSTNGTSTEKAPPTVRVFTSYIAYRNACPDPSEARAGEETLSRAGSSKEEHLSTHGSTAAGAPPRTGGSAPSSREDGAEKADDQAAEDAAKKRQAQAPRSEEEREKGHVTAAVYYHYFTALGGFRWVLAFLCVMVVSEGTTVLGRGAILKFVLKK